jgi:chromosomal replication initiation ATPase DnaA
MTSITATATATTAADCDAAVAIAVFSALKARKLTDLLSEICSRRGALISDVCGRSRAPSACRARQELWWRIRNHPDRHYSYCEIARFFGRNHATVYQGIAAHLRRSST